MENDLTLLYVEDEEEILENMTFLFEQFVKKVYTASNGEEALKLYFKHKPDILVSDIQLPIIDGLEVAKTVREDNKQIPIIFMTAYDDNKKLQIAKEIFISSYVRKPFTFQTLGNAIEKAIKESI